MANNRSGDGIAVAQAASSMVRNNTRTSTTPVETSKSLNSREA